jgi:hypothetical protein
MVGFVAAAAASSSGGGGGTQLSVISYQFSVKDKGKIVNAEERRNGGTEG